MVESHTHSVIVKGARGKTRRAAPRAPAAADTARVICGACDIHYWSLRRAGPSRRRLGRRPSSAQARVADGASTPDQPGHPTRGAGAVGGRGRCVVHARTGGVQILVRIRDFQILGSSNAVHRHRTDLLHSGVFTAPAFPPLPPGGGEEYVKGYELCLRLPSKTRSAVGGAAATTAALAAAAMIAATPAPVAAPALTGVAARRLLLRR